jgi:hypothetical protein
LYWALTVDPMSDHPWWLGFLTNIAPVLIGLAALVPLYNLNRRRIETETHNNPESRRLGRS